MKKHLNASNALYLSLYWMSACFVYGYTRLYLGRMGFTADQVGLLLAAECAAAMVLQPLLARAVERSARLTMRRVLLGMCLVVLVSGGLLLLPQPKGVLVCLFATMSTMTMTMESFYDGAKDADLLIYNSTIDGELFTLDELLQKSAFLKDFKAVQNGNVWCKGKNLFQEPMGLGKLILDMHRVLTEDAPGELTYLHKLTGGAN